jgi:hypothetical protein
MLLTEGWRSQQQAGNEGSTGRPIPRRQRCTMRPTPARRSSSFTVDRIAARWEMATGPAASPETTRLTETSTLKRPPESTDVRPVELSVVHPAAVARGARRVSL